ncbi:tetratricopeptide repeat protein [Streptomyces buecherae]|uniref:AfsR/SARP family transcriptional regulator n=1 Tax=Streptomyces buecherae TaxID=2763006 RepID=UPI0033C18D82
MELEIRLSGSVEVQAAGRRGDLRFTKTRLTLAALAWDASRTVSVDTLVHRVWDDHPPSKAREALHSHVSRIRRALQVAGSAAPEIVSRTNSYVMRIDPERVDLCRYTRHVNRGRALHDSRDDESALALLESAETIWRGEALAGINGSWAEHLRAAVRETSLIAAMTRGEILISMGRFADAVPVLAPLLEQHPVDEALVERLAVALYGGNRAAEATKLLQATRRRIAHETGLDAGRRLHRVHQAILSEVPAVKLLQRRGGVQREQPQAVHPVPDNMPRDVPWVGRGEEIRRLGLALTEGDGASSMVLTVEAIDGMGGVGKTSLAVHMAHQLRDRFPDGRLFLHLSGRMPGRTAPPPDRLLTELLRLVGMNVKELPRSVDELVALWRSLARDRRMLVILDDAADSEQVRPLLPGSSPTAIIVTSRRRLPGLPGVRALSLGVLSREDAVALFHQRLGTRSGIREEDVAEIVRICGYLPLAIEIAASRLLARPSWHTADLLRQLVGSDKDLSALRDGERAIAHVFDLSYRALDAEQQLVFRRIGLHGGVEFGPPAVAALTGLSVTAAEHLLEDLMAQHLVSEPTPHRFTMHSLLRRYARSLLEAGDPDSAEDAERAVRDLVAYYVNVADRADRLAYPYRSRMACEFSQAAPAGPAMLDAQTAEQWLLIEGPNLLEALDWIARHGTDRDIAVAAHVLAGFLDMEGHIVTAEPLLQRAVEYWGGEGDGAARVRGLLDLSAVHHHGSRYEESISAAREALEGARFLRDTELEGECSHQLAIALWQTGQYASAQALQERSLESMVRTGNRLQIARSRNVLGILNLHLAKMEEANDCFEGALGEFTEIGDERGKGSALNNLAELYKRTGRPVAAERAYREALYIAEGMGSARIRATVHINLASALVMQGRIDEALDLYNKALPVLRAVGDQRAEAIALNGIGQVYQAAGRTEEALPQHAAALALARRIYAAGEEAQCLYDLACAERDAGKLVQAIAHFEDSLSVSERIGAPAEASRAAHALAELRGVADGSLGPGR